MKIKKMDGRIVKFEKSKIANAVSKALTELKKNNSIANNIANMVTVEAYRKFRHFAPTVEDVQDLVEKELIKEGLADVAKAYILYREKRKEIREAKKVIGVSDELKLGINAIKVLQARYLAKNEKGEIAETPSQLFRRVAKEIAAQDKRHGINPKKAELEFYQAMISQEFMPNSPTLMNAGTPNQMLSACFTSEQPVLTSSGFKPICEICVGDSVITHTGKEKVVLANSVRQVDNYIYKIKIRGLFNNSLSVTPEHPILALKKEDIRCVRLKGKLCNGFLKGFCSKKSLEYKNNCDFIGGLPIKPRWIKVKDLKENDFVVITTNKKLKNLDYLKISEIIPEEFYLRYQNFLRVRGRPNKGKLIPNEIKIDNGFMRLVGYWLSDGSLSSKNKKPEVIRFTFNKKEMTFCNDVLALMKNKFNLNSIKELNDKQNTIQLRFHSTIVASFFKILFKHGFKNKDIPDWMNSLPHDKQFSLLVGLFRGDGCHHNGEKQDIFFLSLSNYNLASKIWNILLRMGYNFNISSRKPLGGSTLAYRISAAPSECKELVNAVRKNKYLNRKRFPQYIKLQNFILRSISKISLVKFKGKVYNLEVEGDHSYIANGVAVHNCFVLPINDSLDGIFGTLKDMAKIQQTGGGTGFSFSRLRPKGDIVGSTHGVSSGPVSFIRVYDMATDVIKQGSRRRGANMGILNSNHPDIMEFVTIKGTEGQLKNFNISVAADDKFMKAALKGKKYALMNPHSNKIVSKANARDLFELITTMAWRTGDPGMVFLDEINRRQPTPKLGKIESMNPCGELPLLPYESCNLGSINLSKVVNNGKIDWNKLRELTKLGVHFLDNVIDANNYPVKETEKITRANRKIGLGVMGLAEMFIQLGIKYDSNKALKTAEKLIKFMKKEADKASRELAKKRGSFPNLRKSRVKGPKRNATVLSIAPTGTISIIAEASSGIEPLFAISFVREVLEGTQLLEVNPLFEKIAKERGFYSKDLMIKISKKGSIQDFKEIPKDVRNLFVTALDIKPEWHVKMQAVFQRHVDNAVSKTVNLPYDSSIEDVKKIYLLAYKMKCKGITIYRYGSKKEQVLYIGDVLKREKPEEEHVKAHSEYSGGCATGECPF